ncbi:hypothetical protein LCGC14_0382610 [marine sediment metagenome]|uniref:Uncharacterized protein n=1 Tax=marine sediment metagenome TaxID=412755 RepID=A0A0F9TK51_9ZZZZ
MAWRRGFGSPVSLRRRVGMARHMNSWLIL